MSHRVAVIALSILLAAVAAGCGAKQAALPHAVYANDVPIYPGATLDGMMGSTSAGDTPESVSDGMNWSFVVRATAAEQLDFYREKLPQATRDPEWTDGVRLVWVPQGAERGEDIEIILGTNQLSIRENVRPGKRPGNPNAWSQDMVSGLGGGSGEGSSDD